MQDSCSRRLKVPLQLSVKSEQRTNLQRSIASCASAFEMCCCCCQLIVSDVQNNDSVKLLPCCNRRLVATSNANIK
jgi:hypothetical protein